MTSARVKLRKVLPGEEEMGVKIHCHEVHRQQRMNDLGGKVHQQRDESKSPHGRRNCGGERNERSCLP